MKIIETHPRETGFVLWGHCQNLLDDPRISCFSCNRINSTGLNKRIFSHIRLGIRDGGQDTPAGVS